MAEADHLNFHLPMKHLEEYNRIILFRQQHPLPEEIYGERHHIVPRSICPMLTKAKDNLIRLTAQEHFLAHYHLYLAYKEELKEPKWASKMCYALVRMKLQLTKCEDTATMAKLYEEVRLEFSKVHSEALKGHRSWSKGKPAWNKGKKTPADVRRKLSISHKGQKSWNKGKRGIYSPETRKKMAQVGERNPNFGKKRSDETRRKISEANKGRVFTEEHRRKLSEAHKKKK